MKILVALPCYDGKIHVETMKGIISALYKVYEDYQAIKIDVIELSGISLIQHARNALATEFINLDYDKLMFIDSDIGFKGHQLLDIALENKDIVAAVYPTKQVDVRFTAYPLVEGENNIKVSGNLIEMDYMPLGFSVITRKVFETLAPLVKTYLVGDKLCREFFKVFVSNGNLIGEDVYFCNLAKKNGFKLWCNPYIKLEHIGHYSYSASFNDALNQNNFIKNIEK